MKFLFRHILDILLFAICLGVIFVWERGREVPWPNVQWRVSFLILYKLLLYISIIYYTSLPFICRLIYIFLFICIGIAIRSMIGDRVIEYERQWANNGDFEQGEWMNVKLYTISIMVTLFSTFFLIFCVCGHLQPRINAGLEQSFQL